MPDNVGYYSLMALSGLLGIAKGIVLANLLGADGFGWYGLAVVLGSAAQFAVTGGSVEGLTVRLPSHYVKGEDREAATLALASARMIVARGGVISLLAIAILAVVNEALILGACLLGLATALTTVPMVVARSRGNLHAYGVRMFSRAAGTLVLAVTGSYVFGPIGAVGGEFLGALIIAVLLWGDSTQAACLQRRDVSRLDRELRKKGWPLLMQQVNFVAQQNIERWVVVATLGLDGVGKYSFAQLFMTAVYLIHATFYQQVGASTMRSLAAGEAGQVVRARVLRFAAGLGVAYFVAVSVFAVPVLHALKTYMPAFSDLNGSLVWLAAAGLAQMMNHFDWILIGKGGQHWIGRIAWAASTLTCVLGLTGFLLDFDLEYFFFAYFVVRLFILATTFAAAWRVAEN